MHTFSAKSRNPNPSVATWVAVILCAAASCSQSSSGHRHAPDGSSDGPMAGGATGGKASTAPSSTGGPSGGAVSESAPKIGPGGATSSGGAALGGTATGGSGKDSSGSPRDGGTAGESRPDGGIAVDASARGDGPLADMPAWTEWDRLMAGTWLVGWSSGDDRHYSWVRLSGTMGGTTDYLSGATLPANTPFWACDGQSSWFSTEAPYSIMLRFPPSCPSGLPAYFTFHAAADTAVAPPGATFGMVSPSRSSSQPPTEWWRYPDDQCDTALSTCKSPF